MDERKDGFPERFPLGGSYRQIREVLDQWPGEGHLYLKVRADDGGIYILRSGGVGGDWTVVVYADGTRPDTRLSGD